MEFISIVVGQQFDYDQYSLIFKDWVNQNVYNIEKDVFEEQEEQEPGASHVRSATDSSMASAGVDAMSVSSQTATVPDRTQRLLEWLNPQSTDEDLSIVPYEQAYGLGTWMNAAEVRMVDPDSMTQGVLKYIEKKLRDLYRWQRNWDDCSRERKIKRANDGQCRMATGTSCHPWRYD